MVKRIGILLLFLLGLNSAFADSTFVQPRLLRASATLAPGYMLTQPATSFYLHGYLEYFPEQRISLRGDAFWFLSNNQGPELLRENSKVMAGIFYHFPFRQHDVYAGLQPRIFFANLAMSHSSQS